MKHIHYTCKKGLLRLFLVPAICIIYSSFLYANSTFRVSSCITSISSQDSGVKRNVYLAARKLNGIILEPGAVISFNEIVGEGSYKNGFVDGRVLYMDSTSMEPGGGLCQVSSTLYNALLLAGCAIVERYRHYQPVTYVPLGLDATIKYGKKDLRMKNPFNHRLYISAEISSKTLSIVIQSDIKHTFRFELENDVEELEIPFKEKSENIRKGYTVHVYRKKFKGPKFIESFLLYRDFYPPVRFQSHE